MRLASACISLGITLMTLTACDVSVTVGGQEDGLKGSGVEASETREVGPFQRVRIDGAGTLELSTGELSPLTLTGDDNILPLIETTVEDGLLVIRPTESISPDTDLVFRATVPDLTSVGCAGAANIVATGLDAQTFAIEVRGAAQVDASGKTGDLSIDVAGAGSVDTVELKAQDVTVDLKGACNAVVHADKTLAVTIAGIGGVRYDGDAKLVKKEVSALGFVKKR